VPANVWSGSICHSILWNVTPSIAQFAHIGRRA
jgi:hypothetical protein